MINERINNLRVLMKERGIDYYIIPTADSHGSEYLDRHFRSREYMTGFTGSAGTFLVSADEAILFVDGRYHIQAEEECRNTEIKLFKLGLKGVPNCPQYLRDKSKNNNLNRDDKEDKRLIVGFYGGCFDQTSYEKLADEFECYIEEDLVDIIWKERPPQSSNPVFIMPDVSIEEESTDGSSSEKADSVKGTLAEVKIERVREFLEENNLDGILVSELSDICWLLNLRGSDIDYNPVMFSYLLIMKDSCTVFLQDNTYDEKEINYLKGIGCGIGDYKEIRLELAKLKNKRIGIDPSSSSCLNVKILECGNYVNQIKNYQAIKKHIKDQKEINLCRKYHELDAVAMIRFMMWVKYSLRSECCNEYEAAKYLNNLRAKNPGFVSLSFETISAYGENAAIVHYSPDKETSRKLSPWGFLLVDSGAQYLGATTDVTRTISLGELTEEEKRDYTLVLKGNLNLMNAVFLEGCRGENLDILAREALWKQGVDYLHGTGHGVGAFLNVHEGPCSIRYKINNENPQPPLQAGMILSDEPGVYVEGKYGIRHETQLLIKEKIKTEYGKFLEFEPLTLVPFERDAILVDIMSSDEIEILNRYHKMCYERVEKYLSDEEKLWLKEATKEV